MRIIVQVPLLSTPSGGDPPSGAGAPLKALAEELGISFQALHPGSADPQLASYFTAEVADVLTAERVLDRLRRSEGIEAAYLKPPDEPP